MTITYCYTDRTIVGNMAITQNVSVSGELILSANGIRFSDGTAQISSHLPPLPSYFMKAQLLSPYTGFTSSTSNATIPGMIECFYGANKSYGHWNTLTNEWECPNTDFYNIRASAEVTSPDTDALRAALLKIIVSPANGIDPDRVIGIGGLNMGNQWQSEGDEWYLNTSTIDLIQYQDTVRLELQWFVHSSSNPPGITVGNKATYIDIQRLPSN